MAKVFVIVGSEEYQSDEIIAVRLTTEAADKALKRAWDKRPHGMDSYEIRVFDDTEFNDPNERDFLQLQEKCELELQRRARENHPGA